MNKLHFYHDGNYENQTQLIICPKNNGIQITIQKPMDNRYASITLDIETSQDFINEMQEWLEAIKKYRNGNR